MKDVRDVVLLHGWGSGAAVWDELARRLQRRYRVHWDIAQAGKVILEERLRD